MARPKGQQAVVRDLVKEARKTRLKAEKMITDFEKDTGLTIKIPDEKAYVDAAKRRRK